MAIKESRPWQSFLQMVMDCMTCQETSGSGSPTGTAPTITQRSQVRSCVILSDPRAPSILMNRAFRSVYSEADHFYVQTNIARVTWWERAEKVNRRARAITSGSGVCGVQGKTQVQNSI